MILIVVCVRLELAVTRVFSRQGNTGKEVRTLTTLIMGKCFISDMGDIISYTDVLLLILKSNCSF